MTRNRPGIGPARLKIIRQENRDRRVTGDCYARIRGSRGCESHPGSLTLIYFVNPLSGNGGEVHGGAHDSTDSR
jgi:hypothetical protein